MLCTSFCWTQEYTQNYNFLFTGTGCYGSVATPTEVSGDITTERVRDVHSRADTSLAVTGTWCECECVCECDCVSVCECVRVSVSV